MKFFFGLFIFINFFVKVYGFKEYFKSNFFIYGIKEFKIEIEEVLFFIVYFVKIIYFFLVS